MNRRQPLRTHRVTFLLPLCRFSQNFVNKGKMYIDNKKSKTYMCINGNTRHSGQEVAVMQHGCGLIKGNFISTVTCRSIFVSGKGYSIFFGDSTQHIHSINNPTEVVVSDSTQLSITH